MTVSANVMIISRDYKTTECEMFGAHDITGAMGLAESYIEKTAKPWKPWSSIVITIVPQPEGRQPSEPA